MKYCSIEYLLEISVNSNFYLSSLRSGGRTVNERPTDFVSQSQYGADIDLFSAYGTQLVNLYFPIGKPRFYYKASTSLEVVTLGDFMKKNFQKCEKIEII